MLTGDRVVTSKQTAAIIRNWHRERAVGIHENFLSNPEEKAKLLDQLKARKGEHFTDFALKYKNSRNKHLSIWNICPFVI